MPNDNKLYLCFEYCEFDLKKYMKSQSYKVKEPATVTTTPRLLAPPTLVHAPLEEACELHRLSVEIDATCLLVHLDTLGSFLLSLLASEVGADPGHQFVHLERLG